MTRVVLLSQDADLSALGHAIRQAAPELEIFTHGAAGAEQAQVAVCWNPPSGAMAGLAKLRLIHSIAAGVDHIYADPQVPDVPICRVVDPDLKRGMAEYVLWGVLHYHRGFDRVQAQQRAGQWATPPQVSAAQRKIGVLGLGELGTHVALQLAGLGFDVRGWARSAKAIAGMQCWAGPAQFGEFLNGLDCLICLLPLTAETAGILNAATFARLSHGAALINCGRGGHLVIADVLAAVQSGQLRGALLDAFEQEPLPPDSPLWQAEGITVTPHMASSAANSVVAAQVIENIGRLARGEALLNRVDARLGY